MNISKYEQQGFIGVDVNLKISLLEYGLIWKEYKVNLKSRGIDKGDIIAIYCPPVKKSTNQDIKYKYFAQKDLIELTWVNWYNVADYLGSNVNDLKDQPTGNILFDLIQYYGGDEFF